MNVVIQHVENKGRERFVDSIVKQLSGTARISIVTCDGNPMETFKRCLSANDSGHWHLEDDIVLSHSFALRAKKLEQNYGCGIISGFSTKEKSGFLPASTFLWNQCVYIPSGWGAIIAKLYRNEWGK